MSMTLQAAAPSVTDVLTEKQRISSIDIMRGIVMVIMALDHARDFFHLGASAYNPTDMNTTTPALFITRWITHFCAPTFVFLAGTSIYLNAQKKSKKDLSIFLLTRGLWLIVLEVVVVRFAILFNFYYDVIIFQVIWVIGAAMVCMSLLTHLRDRVVLIIGLAIVFGHNLADLHPLQPTDTFYIPWAFLRQSAFIPLASGRNLMVIYPLLPWLGIMLLGYCVGELYSKSTDAQQRQKLLLRLGFAAIGLFLLLRVINVYGDPAPWSTQKDGLFTVLSFLNTTKYPPSLLYTLMTIGPMMVLLSRMERINVNALKPFAVFGRVPMFYYILHFSLIHAISILLFMNKTGDSFSEIDFHFGHSLGGITAEGGYSLFWVYVGWMSVVLFLYPLCKWYNNYKSSRKDWWLSYL